MLNWKTLTGKESTILGMTITLEYRKIQLWFALYDTAKKKWQKYCSRCMKNKMADYSPKLEKQSGMLTQNLKPT